MCSVHVRQCLRKRSNIGEVVIDFAVPLKRGHALRATIRCTVATWVKVQQMVAGVGRVREVSEAEDLQVPGPAKVVPGGCCEKDMQVASGWKLGTFFFVWWMWSGLSLKA